MWWGTAAWHPLGGAQLAASSLPCRAAASLGAGGPAAAPSPPPSRPPPPLLAHLHHSLCRRAVPQCRRVEQACHCHGQGRSSRRRACCCVGLCSFGWHGRWGRRGWPAGSHSGARFLGRRLRLHAGGQVQVPVRSSCACDQVGCRDAKLMLAPVEAQQLNRCDVNSSSPKNSRTIRVHPSAAPAPLRLCSAWRATPACPCAHPAAAPTLAQQPACRWHHAGCCPQTGRTPDPCWQLACCSRPVCRLSLPCCRRACRCCSAGRPSACCCAAR